MLDGLSVPHLYGAALLWLWINKMSRHFAISGVRCQSIFRFACGDGSTMRQISELFFIFARFMAQLSHALDRKNYITN